jgi:hypothetical protein
MSGQGTAILDFGAFPGASDASVVVTGQTGILSGSLVEAWIFPAATTDHLADEHMVETLMVMAGNVVAGVGFTIYGFNTNTLFENPAMGGGKGGKAGLGTMLYGKWNVGWVWN